MKRLLTLMLMAVLFSTMVAMPAGAAPEKITILYPGEESDRMTEFLRGEFAERMLADLNLEVEMIYVNWDLYWDKKDIMLADPNGAIDLYWDGLPDLSTMMNKKQCQPLDGLLAEYGQDMLKVMPMEHIDGGRVDGVLYGIPSAYGPSACMFQFVCLRQDLLEEAGMEKVEKPDDLYDFAKAIMEKDPTIKGGGDPLVRPITRYFGDEQYSFVALAEIIAFGEESLKAYHYYETEAFRDLCRFNSKMSADGLYSDDETLRYNERDSRIYTGNYLWVEGSLGKDQEAIGEVRGNVPDARLSNYLLAPDRPKYIIAAGGEVMCIPYTAPNPAGAMKFLNWLYASQENYDFAIYGVEGKDYEIVDGRVVGAEGDVGEQFFYEWMFRNKHYQRFLEDAPQEYIEQCETWDDDAIFSKAFGFIFDNENVKEIESRLEEARKMMVPLETGFVDFETEYPKAIQAMKDAGIDEYVAEVQRQIDAYIAAQ